MRTNLRKLTGSLLAITRKQGRFASSLDRQSRER